MGFSSILKVNFWDTLYKTGQVWNLMNDQSPVQRLQRMHNANICRTKLIKLWNWILHCPYWHWCFLRVGERRDCLWSCPLCERKVNNRKCKWRISIWHQQFSSTMSLIGDNYVIVRAFEIVWGTNTPREGTLSKLVVLEKAGNLPHQRRLVKTVKPCGKGRQFLVSSRQHFLNWPGFNSKKSKPLHIIFMPFFRGCIF